MRNLTLKCLHKNIVVKAEHVSGLNNAITDALSRFQMDRFRRLAPAADREPSKVPIQLWQIFEKELLDWFSLAFQLIPNLHTKQLYVISTVSDKPMQCPPTGQFLLNKLYYTLHTALKKTIRPLQSCYTQQALVLYIRLMDIQTHLFILLSIRCSKDVNVSEKGRILGHLHQGKCFQRSSKYWKMYAIQAMKYCFLNLCFL